MPSGLETLGQGHRGENRNVYTLTQADDVPWYLPSAGIISLWQKNTCGNCAELPLRMTFSQSVATREHAWMLIMAMISYEEQAVFDLYAFACACACLHNIYILHATVQHRRGRVQLNQCLLVSRTNKPHCTNPRNDDSVPVTLTVTFSFLSSHWDDIT